MKRIKTFIFEYKQGLISFKNNIIVVVSAISSLIVYIQLQSEINEELRIQSIIKKESQAKEKLRWFKLNVTEGYWSNKVEWVMRDKPLTDEELESLIINCQK